MFVTITNSIINHNISDNDAYSEMVDKGWLNDLNHCLFKLCSLNVITDETDGKLFVVHT